MRFAGWRALVAAGLVGLGALCEGATILLLVPILGVVTGSNGGWAGEMASTLGFGVPSLHLLLAVFVAAIGARALVHYARDTHLAKLQLDFVEHLRLRLLRGLATAPWPRVAGLRHADVTNMLTTEASRVAAATHHLVQGGVATVMLAAQATVALALAPALAATIILVMGLGVALIWYRGSTSRTIGGTVTDANRALLQSAGDLLGGLKIAAAENAQSWFVDEFRQVQKRLNVQSLTFVDRLARSRSGFAIVTGVAGAIIVWAGVRMNLAASVLVTMIVVFARMMAPATILQQALQNIWFGIPGFEAIVAMEAQLPTSAQSAVVTGRLPAAILKLREVTYRHAGGDGIDAVTLSLQPGEFLGVTGPSGSGKTTLVDVIAGLVSPHSGTLMLGDREFDDETRAEWRQSLSYVAQEPFLFHDTIRRNLLWQSSASGEEIAAALVISGADGVVAKLEHGLDTVVGERGSRLSGGERQRLSLARALIRRPMLLILDEATSALDIAAEREVLMRLVALQPRPTIVLIAHRAESLAHCDRVVRIVDGRVKLD